jgi:hypothetical protein
MTGALYRELIKVGIAPTTADGMELWQIAELMKGGDARRGGDGRPTSDGVSPDGAPMSEQAFEDESAALLRARVAAARAGQEYTPDLPAEPTEAAVGTGEVIVGPNLGPSSD